MGRGFLGGSEDAAITMSFMTLGMSMLWFVLNLRSPRSSIWNNNIVRNGWIWASIAACLVLLMAAVYLPGLNTLLQTEALYLRSWGVVLLLSLVPVTAGQIYLGVRKPSAGDD
jgi:Ca2+-transporting ATPase